MERLMTFETIDLKPRIGTAVTAKLESLLDGSIGQQLRRLLEQRGVLLFRGLDMTDEQQLQFAKTLGTPVFEDGSGIGKVSADESKSPAWAEVIEALRFFHFDDPHMNTPALAGILRAVSVAPVGGQTEFANTYAIYDDLPEAERRFFDTLQAVHSKETFLRKAVPNPTESQLSRWGDAVQPSNTLPLVWQHRTGRKSLLIGETISRIVGMDPAEGHALVRRLLALAERPDYLYRHEWQVGDVLIWDNTGTMHRAVPYDRDFRRELHRVKLAGEEPVADTTKAAA
jgi:alpha-ketoglutarate-dependent taurine dioxygenase